MCTLMIIPPARAKSLTLKFDREQIVSSKTFKVDINGDMDSNGVDSYGIVLNQYGKDAAVEGFEIQREAMKRKSEEATQRLTQREIQLGMEQENAKLKGQFDSQRRAAQLHELNARNMKQGKQRDRRHDLPKLDGLKDYATREADGQYMLTMRKYNVADKRRRVSSLSNKINMYAAGTKDKLVIRENRNAKWQGILGIIFGVFSFLLSMLLGQFAEPKKKTRGPGARSKINTTAYSSSGRVASMPRRSPHQTQRTTKPKAYGGYDPGKNSYRD